MLDVSQQAIVGVVPPELGEAKIREGGEPRAVADYYDNYARLGIQEKALIELALETAPRPSAPAATGLPSA